MAFGIVGALQEVHVEQRHGHGAAAFLGFHHVLLEPVAVGQVGQGVGLGGGAQNLIQIVPAFEHAVIRPRHQPHFPEAPLFVQGFVQGNQLFKPPQRPNDLKIHDDEGADQDHHDGQGGHPHHRSQQAHALARAGGFLGGSLLDQGHAAAHTLRNDIFFLPVFRSYQQSPGDGKLLPVRHGRFLRRQRRQGNVRQHRGLGDGIYGVDQSQGVKLDLPKLVGAVRSLGKQGLRFRAHIVFPEPGHYLIAPAIHRQLLGVGV